MLREHALKPSNHGEDCLFTAAPFGREQNLCRRIACIFIFTLICTLFSYIYQSKDITARGISAPIILCLWAEKCVVLLYTVLEGWQCEFMSQCVKRGSEFGTLLYSTQSEPADHIETKLETSLTHVQNNRQSYSSVHFNLCVFWLENVFKIVPVQVPTTLPPSISRLSK
jgi:hypothetical protein